MRTRVRFRVWDLNWHWNADGFDARSRRPAQLENPLAGLQSGRLFDGVRTGSQQPAALRLRTFNSRLVRGSTPPPVPHIPTLRGWYFFAYSFGFMRVCGECCGLWRRGFGVLKERVLSLGADSLWESVPVIWVEVREWFFINSLKSMSYLRTDRASFCVALVGNQNFSSTLKLVA